MRASDAASIPSPIERAAAPGRSAGRVGADLMCRVCGHNLRTLPVDAVCTECGTPIRHTLAPIAFSTADEAWIRRACAGVQWLTLLLPWLWLPLTWPIALGALALVSSRRSGRSLFARPLGLLSLALMLAGLSLVILALRNSPLIVPRFSEVALLVAIALAYGSLPLAAADAATRENPRLRNAALRAFAIWLVGFGLGIFGVLLGAAGPQNVDAAMFLCGGALLAFVPFYTVRTLLRLWRALDHSLLSLADSSRVRAWPSPGADREPATSPSG